MVGLEQQAVDVVRVDLQGLGQLLLGRRPDPRRREGTGQQVVEPRVLGGGLRGLAERLRREGVVLLVQGQLGRGEVGVDEVGLLLDGDVVELVEHLLGVGAAEEEVPPEADPAFRRGVPRGGRPDSGLDRVEGRRGVGIAAVVAVDVAAEQEQSDAPGEPAEAILERGERGGVQALGQVGLDLQEMPALDPGAVADFLGGQAGGVVVAADPEGFFGLPDVGGTGRCREGGGQECGPAEGEGPPSPLAATCGRPSALVEIDHDSQFPRDRSGQTSCGRRRIHYKPAGSRIAK